MLKLTRKLFTVIMIALVASLTLAPAAQAAYDYKMTVTVDGSRVALSAVSPPAGFGFIKCITIDNAKVSGTSNLTDFPVLVSIQNDSALRTTANGGRVTDDQGDDLVFYALDLTTRLESEVEQYDGATGTLIAWVRLPELKHDEDTVFYLAYGNDTINDPLGVASDVWDSNYQGVWHLDQDQAGTGTADLYRDSTAGGNHGDDQVSATGKAGQIGAGQQFDGNNDYVNMGNVLDYGKNDPITYSAWIKTSSSMMSIAGKANDSNWQGVWFYLEGPNLSLQFYDADTDYKWRGSTQTFNDNQWHHVVATYDGSDDVTGIKLYADGAQLTIGSSDNQILDTVKNSNPFNIGATNNGFDPFNGYIDEVRLSDTVRSADWIATEYNNQSDPGGFMTIAECSPLVDFPVLVSILNDAQLKTEANGGQVTDAEGDDIIFTADAAGLSPLNHEVESYDGTTGTLMAWVRLPSLVASEDTVFYLHYGNSAVSSPQGNAPAVWDSNFNRVYHLNENVTDDQTGGIHIDSTGTLNGIQDRNGPVVGWIAGAQNFDGNADYVNIDNLSGIVNAVSVSAWVNHNILDTTNDRHISLSDEVAIRHSGADSVGQLRFYIRTGDGSTYRHLTANNVLTAGDWYHVMGTWDGQTQRLYLNGQELNSQVLAETLFPPDSTCKISHDVTTMDGIIDEVRISNIARPANWITTTYNNQRWPNKAEHPVEGFITVQRGVCDIGVGALPVSCGSTTPGSIETPGAWDAFQVILGADTWLEVYTTGTTDTYGHLYDENCVEIAQDDTVDYNFHISQPVAAGRYYVQVRHASETGTGDYELSLECGDDDHGDSIDEATPIDCNSSIGGNIESGGDEDYFKVVFWGTGILTAYTTDGSDPSGRLLDEAGNPIAADEDSGAGNNFRIAQTVDPGVYYVVVKEKAADGTGSYTLHVNCEYTPVITASAEYGGTISPVGAVGVTYNGAQTFTITLAAGNTIRDVWVDDRWVGAVSSYQFQNVQTDHKIVAVFNADFENCVDIPDIPLDAWYRSAPANVMFVLDDSGSMDWEFMTTADDGLFDNYYRYVFDNPGDNLYGRVLSNDRRMKWKSQWAGYNKLYYDPAVTYDPWPNHVAGDSAPTLDPADPDTPRSHPMHAGTTFDLNGTYFYYTSDAIAIIVDNGDGGFSKTVSGTGGGGEQTLLSTGFEGGDWDDGFENNGATDWNPDSVQQHGGTYSAWATRNSGSLLTSDDLDTSDLRAGDSISLDFWIRKDDIESNEFTLYYYDGAGYNFIADLDTLGRDDRWLRFQGTISDSRYFKSNFRIQFNSSVNNRRENVWVDDVVIKKNAAAGGWEYAEGSDQAENGDYWWTGADGDYTATWTASIPTDDSYDVYARWPADVNHSASVSYTVDHSGGSNSVDVDQSQNGGKWVKLGTFDFQAAVGATVTLSHTRSGDNDRACADAIKIAPAGALDVIDIKQAHYYAWSESEARPYLVVLDGDIDYYAVTDGDGDDKIESGEITVAATPPADVQPGRTYEEERQNFANWYQFYRRRELTATAAVANVIVGLKGVHVGFYSINGNLVQPVLPVKSANIDKSKSLLQALYNLKVRAQGTPLRRGLREVGKYFASSSDMIGSSPYATAENGGGCQQAFSIVMTDGFWNGSSPGVGNADGDDNTAFDGGGRADIYADTLADVAMHYYENDLHAGLDDDIPSTHLDSASHQHMVTYTVSFGRVGSLNPEDYDIANGSYPVWPDPRYVGAHKIDDLWHAAVNGRGEFLSAASPTELVDSLLAISRSIQGRLASSSSVSVNGDRMYNELNEHTRMYQATYRSDSWIGDVSAYQVDAVSGEVADTPDWSAADRLASLNWDSGRIIATYDGSQGIPFRYDRGVLDRGQQRALGSDLVANSPMEQNAVKRLNYLRGDRSNEAQNGGAFRDRIQLLGDIVHSSPVYHDGMLYAGGNDGMMHAIDAASGDEQFAYVPNLVFGNLSYLVDPDYSHKYFVDLSPTVQDVTLGGQAKTILVGGLGKGGKGYYALDVTNAADITDEDELATRVLWEFPDPQSEGRGYLAFDSRIEDIEVGDVIKTQGGTAVGKVDAIPVVDGNTGILSLINVGGSGTFQNGDDLYEGGDKVARANSGLYDPYMGYSFSRPVIVKSNDPSIEWLVIFGNGYNSAKSHAVLYILNPATGAVIKRIDTGVGNCNGLSSPIATDVDNNGTADYVYAGDLQGNLWKFDLTDTDADNWEVAYADAGDPAPVFQAKNYSGRTQPITTKPDVMYHCSQPGYMVIFGTGMYLTEYDMESSESATLYGIWDYGDDDDHREYLGSFERTATQQLSNPHWVDEESWTRVKLLEQTVEPGTWKTTDGQNLRVITDHTPNWGTVDDDDTGQTDPQPDPGSVTAGDTVHAGWYFDLPNSGERVVRDVIIREGKVLVISFTPGQDPCGSGGNSILHAINACNGARPDQDVFVDIDTVVYESPSGDETEISQDSSEAKEVTGIEMSGNINVSFFLRTGDTDSIYINKNNADIDRVNAAATKLGIFYWMQVE